MTSARPATFFLPAIQRALAPDLLREPWRSQVCAGAHPHTGHCYVAAEALWHSLGGKAAGYTPMFIRHEGQPHWFLRGPGGEILDPTAGQFRTPVPYASAVAKGFLTTAPSKRAQELRRRAGLGGLAGLGARTNITVELRRVTSAVAARMQAVGWWAVRNGPQLFSRPTEWDINNGWCEEWAEEAVKRVGGEVADLAALRCEKFGLPRGCFRDVAHTVLLRNGRFYDAQNVEGVADPRQLHVVRKTPRERWTSGLGSVESATMRCYAPALTVWNRSVSGEVTSNPIEVTAQRVATRLIVAPPAYLHTPEQIESMAAAMRTARGWPPKMPRILIGLTRLGTYELYDGTHRLIAAHHAGLQYAEAWVANAREVKAGGVEFDPDAPDVQCARSVR